MTKPVFKTTSRKPPSSYLMEVRGGDWLFREGELGTEMFIIQEGRVEILKRIQDEERQLAVLEKGDFFGEMALLEDLPRTASARALTAGRMVRISGATFDQMLRANPEIAVRMMRKLSRRLRDADRMLHELAAAVSAPEMPTPDDAATAPAAAERLVHARSDMEFALSNGSETTIGRRDPVTGIQPDIDLTPVDTQRSTSRRHAKLYRRGSRYYLAEEIGTMNGTFLNGVRVETGVPVEIQPGDEIRFGLVETRFQV